MTDTVTVDRAALAALLERFAAASEAPDRDETVYDPEGELTEAVAGAWGEAYSALAHLAPDVVADTASSAGRQHYIDTGRYPATD